jgi:hypothetical protein
MPIDLNDDVQRTSTPVVKRQKIGDKFVGAIVRFEQRDVMKKNPATDTLEPSLKPNGKARQELVVTCVAMPKTTSPAGIGDSTSVPEPGDLVRLILRGGAFGDWIEARKSHRNGGLRVGDVVVQAVEFAQCYDASGGVKGGKITDQATADDVPRSTTIGYYGPLTLHEPKPDGAEWVAKAEAAYLDATAITLAPTAPAGDVEDPW